MSEAPYIIIPKAREGGTYKRSIRIARVWRHKETGNVVEIRKVGNVVPDNYIRIWFFDPIINRVLSLPLKPRPHPFQKPGAQSVEMELGFEDNYEVYQDQRSTRI
jgi:hypothetical protein